MKMNYLHLSQNYAQKNESYQYLFKYVWLEYCSVETVKQLLDYVKKELISSNKENIILECLERRLLLSNLPIQETNERYQKFISFQGKEIKSNTLKGILYQENLNRNVLLESNSNSGYDVYNVIKRMNNAYFQTKNELNSYISAKLKNNKSFFIKEYYIRGHSVSGEPNHRIQTWKLEGRKVSDGEWIELDKHENEPIHQSEVKKYSISCKYPLNEVKLTQTGPNTSENNYLVISGFDIYGLLEQSMNKNMLFDQTKIKIIFKIQLS